MEENKIITMICSMAAMGSPARLMFGRLMFARLMLACRGEAE
jgi:hypothetical protein